MNATVSRSSLWMFYLEPYDPWGRWHLDQSPELLEELAV